MKNKKTQNKQQTKTTALLSWSKHAWEDYQSWQDKNKKIVDEINTLIEECLRDSFKGTGKPEPLRGDLTGFWSRRITKEHRLVYLPEGGTLYIVACRYHYTQL